MLYGERDGTRVLLSQNVLGVADARSMQYVRSFATMWLLRVAYIGSCGCALHGIRGQCCDRVVASRGAVLFSRSLGIFYFYMRNIICTVAWFPGQHR